MGRILVTCVREGIRPRDEYLPQVLQMVFVHGKNICPLLWRGYSSTGRILAPCLGEGVRPWDAYLSHKLNTKPTNTNSYLYCIRAGYRLDPLCMCSSSTATNGCNQMSKNEINGISCEY